MCNSPTVVVTVVGIVMVLLEEEDVLALGLSKHASASPFEEHDRSYVDIGELDDSKR